MFLIHNSTFKLTYFMSSSCNVEKKTLDPNTTMATDLVYNNKQTVTQASTFKKVFFFFEFKSSCR